MSHVTRILSAIEQGDSHAAEQLLPLVHESCGSWLRPLHQLEESPRAKQPYPEVDPVDRNSVKKTGLHPLDGSTDRHTNRDGQYRKYDLSHV